MKWILVFFLLCFVLALPLMYGVGGRRSSNKGSRDYAVAEFDGQKLMMSQLQRNSQLYAEQAKLKDITSRDLPGIHQAVLDQMVIDQQLKKEVKALGIKPSEQEIDKTIAQISQQFPTKEAFQQYLDNSGIDLKKLRESISTQLAKRMLLEEASAAATVDDKEMKEFYDSVKKFLYFRPAGVNANIARFKNMEVAESVRKLLLEGGKWDAVMAGVASSDITDSSKSGDPVFIPETAMNGKFEFIKDLESGDISLPMTGLTSDDIVLVLRGEKLEERTLPFDEVSGDVKNYIIGQKKSKLQEEYLEKLKEKSNVKILDPSLFPAEEPEAEVMSKDISADAKAVDSSEDAVAEINVSVDASSETEPTASKDNADLPESADSSNE